MTPTNPNCLKIVTYYVIPVKKDARTSGPSDKVQDCLYLNEDLKPVDWNELKTGFSSNYVRLLQFTLQSQQFPIELPGETINAIRKKEVFFVERVQLLAAVAKTFQKTSNLPNTFLSSNFEVPMPVTDSAIDPPAGVPFTNQVLLPVSRGTKRGVILIFAKHDETGEVVGLVASSDPEIKNS